MVKKKAGHRSWAPKGGKVKGTHTGDIMSKKTRSALMAKIKDKGTKPERIIIEGLEAEGLKFENHVRTLPGRPDVVFDNLKLAVFVDGDFWHGYRFPLWKHKMALKWQEKIEGNRKRDQRNFRKLRRMGWKVIRIWEHQVENDPTKCIRKILTVISNQGTNH